MQATFRSKRFGHNLALKPESFTVAAALVGQHH
jgi:hypothetical protein